MFKNSPIKYFIMMLIVFNISCFNSIISAEGQSGDDQFDKVLQDLTEQIKKCKEQEKQDDVDTISEELENIMPYCWGSPGRLEKIMQIMDQLHVTCRYS